MIAWAGAAFLVVGFIVLMKLLRLIELNRKVLIVVGEALSVMGDRRLDDRAKEKGMQKLAGRLFVLFVLVSLGGAAAVLLPLAVLKLADHLGWLAIEPILAVALSPLFILVSCLVVIAAIVLLPKKPVESPSNYSLGDQLLHRLAFCTAPIQLAVARVEDRMLDGRLATLDAQRPVFITALPRAGTTMILECLARSPQLASHTYRDMPFLLAPAAWSRFSSLIGKQSQSRERAHGDGMMIGYDSPEALEEVLWLTFWRKPYRADRIVPWPETTKQTRFVAFLKNHMRKIVLLRRSANVASARYVSKNNLNIARLGLLRTLFPEAVVVVPFRNPLQHAMSLLRQHKNFLAIHATDAFASEYMRQIGHFDFGENLAPIDFDGWIDALESKDPLALGFWLEYWTAGYTHILTHHAQSVRLVDYDALCERPEPALRRLGETIGLADPESLFAAAPDIRPQQPREIDVSEIAPSLLDRVHKLHTELKTAAI